MIAVCVYVYIFLGLVSYIIFRLFLLHPNASELPPEGNREWRFVPGP